MSRSRTRIAFVALAAAALMIFGAVPAHAIAINTLYYEPPAFWGLGGGGNTSDQQLADLAAANSEILGVPIDLIGKVTPSTGVFVPATGSNFTTSMFDSFTCNSGSSTSCTDGFTVEFNFAGLGKDWQIVKIVVKADGPNFPNGAFVTSLPLQGPAPLDDIQQGFISSLEYAKYIHDGDIMCVAANKPPCQNDPHWNPAISHIYVFGTPLTPTQVPEPATLTLLGLSVIGVGVIARARAKR